MTARPARARARRIVAMLVVLIAGLAACAEPADERLDVTIAGDAWVVLVAGDDGMRGRADFGGADGMLFDLGAATDPTAVVFVMDGVAFPLDIAWFDADGGLVGTAELPVCSTDPCPRYAAPAPFRWAVEAPLGTFAALGQGPDNVRLEVPD